MISIVIPVYNAEQYLARCLDSIQNSTCQDFQVILVNDGSTDQSLSICRAYSEKDTRIKVLTQENRGVSSARNAGIDAASGDWVLFVDADDFISPFFLEYVSKKEYQSYDLLLFELTASSFGDIPSSLPKKSYTGDDMLQLVSRILVPSQLTEQGHADFRTPCARAYKRKILSSHSIRFNPHIMIGEDLLFNLEYQLKASSCLYLPIPVYHYDIRPGSSSHSFRAGLCQNHVRLLKAAGSALKKDRRFPSVESFFYSYALENLTYILIQEIFHPDCTYSFRKRRRLCKKLRQIPVYRHAFSYNRTWGVLPRKVLVFFFRARCFAIAGIISYASFFYLNRRPSHLRHNL